VLKTFAAYLRAIGKQPITGNLLPTGTLALSAAAVRSLDISCSPLTYDFQVIYATGRWQSGSKSGDRSKFEWDQFGARTNVLQLTASGSDVQWTAIFAGAQPFIKTRKTSKLAVPKDAVAEVSAIKPAETIPRAHRAHLGARRYHDIRGISRACQ
jgi:hypothetical protein